MKRIISLFTALCLITVCFTACSNNSGNSATGDNSDGQVTVRFLNFKPEVAQIYDKIAAAYEKES